MRPQDAAAPAKAKDDGPKLEADDSNLDPSEYYANRQAMVAGLGKNAYPHKFQIDMLLPHFRTKYEHLEAGSRRVPQITNFLRDVGEDLDRDRVYLPASVASAEAEHLRGDGWATIQAMDEGGDAMAEALRLECTHIFEGGVIHALNQD